MTFATKLDQYLRLTRLNKPIGILLLLWPTLWGLWFAGQGQPLWSVVAIFVAGTVLMRSAGCVINDYADRDFDGQVARTKARPLATREVGTREALWLATSLAAIAFLLILPLNALTKWLSVPAVLLAASYPFTKRFFAIPQAYLGIAFGFGIPMAFAALTGNVPAAAWVMLLANVFWSVAYDTAYAMCDREDDLKIGIKTAAITFGRFDVLAILLCQTAFLGLMTWVGHAFGRGAFYCAGLVSAVLLVLLDQYPRIRDRDPQRCFAAFLANNRIGGVIFAGLVLDYLIGG